VFGGFSNPNRRRTEMRRREFLGLLGGAVMSWPRTGHAQPTTSPIVGFLNSASPDGYAAMADAFQQGLNETGYVDGRNVAIEYRWAENRYERLPGLAADLCAAASPRFSRMRLPPPRPRRQPVQFRSFSCTAMIRSGWASSQVSTGREAISPGSLFFPVNWQRSGSSFCVSSFRVHETSPCS